VLGATLALALVEATPEGRKLKNEVLGFYRSLNSKLPSGDYLYGNPVQLTKFSSTLSKFEKGDPLAPLGDDEEGEDAKAVVASYMQEVRLLYSVSKRRVKSVFKDPEDIQRVVRWYAGSSYTIAAKFDPNDSASKLLARLAAIYPMRLDVLYAFGLVFHAYDNEAKVIPPVTTNIAAVNRLVSTLKRKLSTYFDVEVRKYRLPVGDKEYIHPIFELSPKDAAVEGVRDRKVTFSGLSSSARGLARHPDIKKLYDKLKDYAVGKDIEDDEFKKTITKGREAPIPEHLEQLADEILASLGGSNAL